MMLNLLRVEDLKVSRAAHVSVSVCVCVEGQRETERLGGGTKRKERAVNPATLLLLLYYYATIALHKHILTLYCQLLRAPPPARWRT